MANIDAIKILGSLLSSGSLSRGSGSNVLGSVIGALTGGQAAAGQSNGGQSAGGGLEILRQVLLPNRSAALHVDNGDTPLLLHRNDEDPSANRENE